VKGSSQNRGLSRVFADFGGVYFTNGLVAFLFAASGPVAIILAVGTRGGLTPSDLSSWIFGAFFINGLISIAFCWTTRQPLVFFWTIPGAVLLGPALGHLSWPEVIGAFIATGILMLALGLSGWVRRAMEAVPMPIVMGMVAGVFLRGTETVERRPIDWRILGGGIVFGIVVVLLGVSDVPFGQEIIFIISMAVVCYMLVLVTAELDHNTRMGILFTTIIVFAFRATPTVGDGYFWWTLDELNFDASFYGTLRQTGAILSIAVMWMFSRQLTEASVTKTLLWLAVVGTVLSLPNIALIYGVHQWTEAVFGFGARSIAVVDAAASTPFAQLSMVPLLTLTAYYAPPGHRATWFALMASLMNIAVVASQLQTKYLNEIFVVGRGQYAELGPLLIWAVALSFIIPVGAIALFGNRTVRHVAVRH